MLQFLLNNQSFTIKLPNSNNLATYAKPVSDEAKSFLATIAGYDYLDPIEGMWMSGTEAELQRVLEMHQSSPEGRKQVEEILSRQLANESVPIVVFRQWRANLNNLSNSAEYSQLKKLLYNLAVIEDKQRSLSGTTDGGIVDSDYFIFKDK